jgi:hypothetical protein
MESAGASAADIGFSRCRHVSRRSNSPSRSVDRVAACRPPSPSLLPTSACVSGYPWRVIEPLVQLENVANGKIT